MTDQPKPATDERIANWESETLDDWESLIRALIARIDAEKARADAAELVATRMKGICSGELEAAERIAELEGELTCARVIAEQTSKLEDDRQEWKRRCRELEAKLKAHHQGGVSLGGCNLYRLVEEAENAELRKQSGD